jgi:hypothetical protein
VAVLLAAAGLFAGVAGAAGVRVGLIVAGLFLFFASVAFLIDFPAGKG